MQFKRFSRVKLIFALLLLVGLPVFIWAVITQRIELRKQAALTGPTLTIQPSAIIGAAGDTENLGIALDTQGASVSAAEIHLTYNPSVIQINSFTPQSAAPVALPVVLSPASTGSGSATITLGTSPDSPFTGTAIIGDLQITLLSSASAQITFASDTVVTAVGQDTNALVSSTGVSINGGSESTPTPAPTDTPTPTPVSTTEPTNTPTPIQSSTTPTDTPTPTPTPTPTSCINFSDAFSGTSLNTNNWTQYQFVSGAGIKNTDGSVGVANQTATISQPYMAGQQAATQILLQQPASGDIAADVTLTPNMGAHGEADTYVGFQSTNASSALEVGWTNGGGTGSSTPQIVMATYSPTQPWKFNYSLPTPTGITSFHVKLVRIGSTFTGYVDFGNGLIFLGSVPNVFTGNGNVLLETFNDSNGGSTNDVSVGFSNFTLTTCNVTLPTNYLTPEPVEFWVELAGVNGNGANGALINVKFYLKDGTVLQLPPLPLTYTMETTSDGRVGVYTADTTISNPLPSGTQFRVQVTGEKHIALKFCKAVGQTGPCGDNDYIIMPAGTGTLYLNFTGRPLPPGDLNQDGAIDATDIGLFTSLFSKTPGQLTAADYKLGDVNYDGSIDQFDLNLILQSLSTRYSE